MPPAPRSPGFTAARQDPIAARSEPLFRLFTFYLRLLASRRFTAIRLSGIDTASLPRDRPLIIYGNHPSWWDPVLYLLLADRRFRGRPGFGPMEEAALGRYNFFRRLGIFGIDKTGSGGARRFLSVARHVLGHPGGPAGRLMIWVTAEGNFTDPRVRPVRLRPGIAHLAALLPEAMLVPLAIEYVFWNERRPELLVRFGTPLAPATGLRPADWTVRLEAALGETMDRLSVDAQARDPEKFERLPLGVLGFHGPRAAWRRLTRRRSGRPLVAPHGEDA
ncbi:lysophospholipid acyltransferase family protein [Lichenicola sp.]|uniref:lysophospholipid acyltransferase family protein n=1 Tax=Lichenicola sp. TaxID=2804529 RepID=UPI003B009F80